MRILCNSLRLITKSQTQKKAMLHSEYTNTRIKLLLVKNRKTLVIVLEVLLYANFTKNRSLDKLSY